jgi:hypothetical protein
MCTLQPPVSHMLIGGCRFKPFCRLRRPHEANGDLAHGNERQQRQHRYPSPVGRPGQHILARCHGPLPL